jgi:hypothetical protein
MNRSGIRRLVPAAAAVAAIGTVLAASGTLAGAAPKPKPKPFRPATPGALAPANATVVEALPAFAWGAVNGADAYEFQIAADAGFNAPVLGRGKDHFRTRNLRATLNETVPNGTYYWRVRAVTERGSASPWSAPRSVRKAWGATAALQSPTDAAVLTVPQSPVKLSWTAVRRAASYRVSIGTDPLLGSLVGGKPFETTATTFTRTAALAPGTYFWAITPVDAQGNPGNPSAVQSFAIAWPSQTTPRVTDLVAAAEVFDPQFAWDPIAGAARYEVEVNSSQDFAVGSKVCCDAPAIATSLSPTKVLRDNTYYWRMRAIDADGNAGDWNYGPSFTKTFDTVPPVAAPSIKNLRMRDNLADPGTDMSPTPGYQTHVPIVTWSPVPGAASYQVEVTPFMGNDPHCNWSAGDLVRWQVITATTAWTPLGKPLRANAPFSNPATVATDSPGLLTNQKYCARVRARSDRDVKGAEVFGDYTYLDNGLGWAFEWDWYPPGDYCSPSCNPGGYLGAGDYLSPIGGVVVGQTPLFTWRPLFRKARRTLLNVGGGKAVELIARQEGPAGDLRVTIENHALDSAFDDLVVEWLDSRLRAYVEVERLKYLDGNVADFATKINASSGRLTATVLTAALPLAGVNELPLLAGKLSYFVVVAKDPEFTTIVDYAFTQVPAYAPRTSSRATTYSDETTAYYWVVLPATGIEGTGGTAGEPSLGAPASFNKQSAPPTPLTPANGSDELTQPRFQWTSVFGARRYRLQVAQDPSFGNPIEDVLTSSTAYTSNTTYPADTVLYWRVRADDENLVGLTWSQTWTFRKRLPTPVPIAGNPTAGDFIPTWSWDAMIGAISYDVAVDLPDGSHRDLNGLRSATLTPVLMYGTGVFRWKVRANFPKATSGSVPGPYTQTYSFIRTIGEPGGARADVSKSHVVLSWEPKAGAKQYRLEISTRPDFARTVEQVMTDNTSYAPLLTQPGYLTGETLYWRVAAVDEGRNVGDFTQAQVIARSQRMRLAARGRAARGRTSRIVVSVTNLARRPIAGATVRVSGAGVRRRAARTNARGTVSFSVRPTKRGKVVFRATKSRYQPGVLTVGVK